MLGNGLELLELRSFTILIKPNRKGQDRKKTSQDHKRLPKAHLIGCRGVKLFLPQYCFQVCQKLNCQNLSFWVLSQYEFWVLSKFRFLCFVTFVGEFCCYLRFKVFVTIWVVGPCHSLSFWVLSQFEFLSGSKLEFLRFFTIFLFFLSCHIFSWDL